MGKYIDQARKHLFDTLDVKSEVADRLLHRVMASVSTGEKEVHIMQRWFAVVGVLVVMSLFVCISPFARQWTQGIVHSSGKLSKAVVPPETEFDASFHTLQPNAAIIADKSGRTTRIQVNIHHWVITPYNTEVFMFLTSIHTPVSFFVTNSDISTSQGQDGFMQLLWPKVNDFLAQHQLATIQNTNTEDQLSYRGGPPGWVELWASAKAPVRGSDWRLVIVATSNFEHSDEPTISWIKIIHPNVALNGSELETNNKI